MSTKMYIYGEARLWACSPTPGKEFKLKYDLNDFLRGRGRVIYDGDDEHTGPQWNVDVLLHENADEIDSWVQQLSAFLQEWGVQNRKLSFTIIRENAMSNWEHRQVELVRD